MRTLVVTILIVVACFYTARAQTSARAVSLDQALKLANSGQCVEALPVLSRIAVSSLDPPKRREIGFLRVRCAMALNRAKEAASAIGSLTEQFPTDPGVLYLAVRVYSDLSIRASQDLLTRAPGSAEVHQLNAETLELQGKWKEATDEYRAILAKQPDTPGIHYRIGRLLLSQPRTPDTTEEARREFLAELKINPANVGSEFVLGELARQDDKIDEAIQHFTRATKLDALFPDAFLGLGQALLAADRPADAVAALEHAAKLQPENPATHFNLASAYRRSGRASDADRAMMAHREASERAQKAKDSIQRASQRPAP